MSSLVTDERVALGYALGLLAVDPGATGGDLFRVRGRNTSGTDEERR